MATPDFLTQSDIQAKVGFDTILGLFDDDNDGAITGTDLTQMNDVLAQAENEAYSRLLRAYDKASIILLANNDPALKGHIAWIALEFASERRMSFLSGDGTGAYWKQYERAIQYCELLSKGQQRSAGETVAGTTDQIGGTLQPTPESTSTRFVFAPDDDNPSGHGGF